MGNGKKSTVVFLKRSSGKYWLGLTKQFGPL